MTSMTERKCKNSSCQKLFQARTADVKRGWAKFCSKSCKAIEQEGRTGQYADLQHREPDTCFPSFSEDAFTY